MPDNKDREGQKYYFTTMQVKSRSVIQFYERIGIDYVKRVIVRIFNIFIYQDHIFLRNKLFLLQLHSDSNGKAIRKRFCVISAKK